MTVDQIIDKYDFPDKKGFEELFVHSELRSLGAIDSQKLSPKELGDHIAFQFYENNRAQGNNWGTYFGPMMSFAQYDGSTVEIPSLDMVSQDVLDSWIIRSENCKNPILVSRYCGLIWDLTIKITGNKPDYSIAERYVSSLLKIAEEEFINNEINVYTKIDRALSIACSLNNPDLIERSKKALIAYEAVHGVIDKPGLWGYAFDNLIFNQKVKLEKSEEQYIIQDLEDKLSRLTTKENEGEKINPWAAEGAADRLANYYRKKSRNNDVKRVLLKLGEAYDEIIEEASGMQVFSWLDHLSKLYSKYNLKEEVDKLLPRIRALGEEMNSDLKSVTTEIDLPQKELTKYLDEFTDGETAKVLERFAYRYIPIKDQIKQQIFDLSKKHPISYLFSQQIQDERGRVVAQIGSLEQDLDGHIVRQVSQNLAFSAMFMRMILNKLVKEKGLNEKDVLDFISSTPIIRKERLEIIQHGLKAYFANDMLTAIHVLIPQIEEAIRNLVEMSGGIVLKKNRGGGYQLRTFDDLLRDQIVIDVLTEDYADYFRILLTDQRGWNIRNNVCHGLVGPQLFNNQVGDRVLHTLLCLGFINER